MALSLSELKKNSTKSLQDLKAAAEKLNSNSFQDEDKRFWQPTVDDNGNGSAIIRFLPAPEGEDIPYVRVFEHGFKGPTGLWYIEKSLTTLGKDDPVSKYNNKLWNSGIESDKTKAREQKRKLYFISNILVVRDPANPENDGKVFLFRYGKKIFDKLNDMMNPTFEDETPVNPFDPWAGANFRLRIRKVDGYRNYDKSEFDDPTEIGSDKEIEAIWKQEHKLQEFLDPANFKSYAELEEKLLKVLDAEANHEPKSFAGTSKPLQSSTESRSEDESAPWVEDDEDELAKFKEMLED